MKKNLQKYSFNGKVLPGEKIHLNDFSRGFLYGDGLFETLRVRNYRIFRWEDHWSRMQNGARVCNLEIGREKEKVHEDIISLLQINRFEDAYVRINLWRKSTESFNPSDEKESYLLVIAKKYTPYPQEHYRCGIKCIISKNFFTNEKSPVTYIKSLNLIENVLARIEAKRNGYDDAILLNTQGKLAEAAVSNVFFVAKNGIVFTPSVECGILSGITRKIIFEICSTFKIKLKEGKFSTDRLMEADEVFLTNTLMGVMPVREIKGIFKGGKFSFTRLLGEEINKIFLEETNG